MWRREAISPNPTPSTLNPDPSEGGAHPQPSTLNPKPQTLNPKPSSAGGQRPAIGSTLLRSPFSSPGGSFEVDENATISSLRFRSSQPNIPKPQCLALAPQYHQADWIFKPENNRIVSGVDVVALHLSLAI
jgi:hypothetical protein